MNTIREQAKINFLQGINIAIKRASQTGFVAAVRFTFLADMMQIQYLRADNTELLEFTLPEGLYSTVKDLVMQSRAQVTTYETKEGDRFILEFASDDEQDKFIKIFEMMSFQGKRAYPAPNLYLGLPSIDQDFCRETIMLLHDIVQNMHDSGWKYIR